MHKPTRIHPAVQDATKDLRNGKVSRREFLRFATLLGVSVPAAYALAGLWYTGSAARHRKRRSSGCADEPPQ